MKTFAHRIKKISYYGDQTENNMYNYFLKFKSENSVLW